MMDLKSRREPWVVENIFRNQHYINPVDFELKCHGPPTLLRIREGLGYLKPLFYKASTIVLGGKPEDTEH